MKNPTDKESVLYAFAVEDTHDRRTLERYLQDYPELSEELVDLSSELRLSEGLAAVPGVAIIDSGLDEAWNTFLAAAPQQAVAPVTVDPFARFRGPAFAALAKALDVPRSILTALRDRLVEPSSVPRNFLRRFAAATGTGVESVSVYLTQASHAPTGLAFKSDEKPSPRGQTTFRQLIQNTQMNDSQRLLLLQECDEDELP
jgi:hypothetical protein